MSKDKSLQSQQSLPAKHEDKYKKLKFLHMPYEPVEVQEQALKELEGIEGKKSFSIERNSSLAMAMTLNEFENGYLMTEAIDNKYRALAIHLSRKYQGEYKCTTDAKKSMAELAAMNYCRILRAQSILDSYLAKECHGHISMKIVGTMSKELDRAQRQYLTALQTLEMSSQPVMNVSVKANTANIANNQAVQQVKEQTNVEAK